MMGVVGLVPAAGLATRISPLPCSKEVFPIGVSKATTGERLGPTVVGSYLLRKFFKAGVRKAFFIIRKGKWDIPQYFGNGSWMQMDLGYLIMGDPYGVPFTLDQAFPFVKDQKVIFGFPDILFSEEQAYISLLECQVSSEADLVLGLFPVGPRQKADRVYSDVDGKILDVLPDSTRLDLSYTWGIAVWMPQFTEFIHEFVEKFRKETDQRSEVSMSQVIHEGINCGLNVQGLMVSHIPFLDIGTSEGLAEALSQYGANFRS
ncbi:MAG: hypothetical protein R3B74_15335 [Nitrospirales bacterium]|nr:hypothetical protein [Nitrospirales bacterium]